MFSCRNFNTQINRGFYVLFQSLGFRAKDWGPAPRWVAFVDFFFASHAKHAVISGAHRRVGTTYAQLIAALAAANRHGNDSWPFLLWTNSHTINSHTNEII